MPSNYNSFEMQIYATERFDTVTDLLSAFMQPFSSGIVAQARPHLVHFLHVNEINTFYLKLIPFLSHHHLQRLLLSRHLQRSSCKILHRGPALEHSEEERVEVTHNACDTSQGLRCDEHLSDAYLHPFVVVVYYCGNLGLLQHDF